MGGTSWSDSAYTSSVSAKAARGYSAFEYDDKIKRGEVARGVHETLDPKKMKAGKRECRDSAEHPEAKPIYVGLDATGSMQQVPRLIQEKFPKLMGLIARGGYVDHPSICVSVIGDSHYDDAPLQVGQFEAGVEIVPGIKSVAAYGHTPGHTLFMVESKGEKFAYLADITNVPQLFARNPDWAVQFDMDAEAARLARRKVFDMIASERVMAGGFHFPFPAFGRVEKLGNGFEFKPVA